MKCPPEVFNFTCTEICVRLNQCELDTSLGRQGQCLILFPGMSVFWNSSRKLIFLNYQIWITWKIVTALIWQKEASDKSDISCKRAKCVCHFHWRQWNIMMSYLTYLLVGWVFLHEIWPGRRAHYVNYKNINNSILDGMSLAHLINNNNNKNVWGFPQKQFTMFINIQIVKFHY